MSTTPSHLSWGMLIKAQSFQVARDVGVFLKNGTDRAGSAVTAPPLCSHCATHSQRTWAHPGLTNPVVRMTGEEEVSKRLLWVLHTLDRLAALSSKGKQWVLNSGLWNGQIGPNCLSLSDVLLIAMGADLRKKTSSVRKGTCCTKMSLIYVFHRGESSFFLPATPLQTAATLLTPNLVCKPGPKWIWEYSLIIES